MNARQHAAWLRAGGGSALIDELLAERKALALPAGNTGGQMAGWFRKELRSVQDLQGMKMRVGGFAGKVFQTLGANPVAMPRDAVFNALQSGSLDMFEWVGPYDDEKFGQPIAKAAPNYYYPGWWKGGMQLHLVVVQGQVRRAAEDVSGGAARGGVCRRRRHARPLRRRQSGGGQAPRHRRRLAASVPAGRSGGLLQDLQRSLRSTLGRQSRFKKIADSFLAFRSDQYLWWQVEEYSFDNFMIRQRHAKT